MNSVEEFVGLIRDELGLPLTVEDASRSLDELPGWDSVHLLWLLPTLERTTGRRIALPEVLAAANLREVYDLAVAA